MTCITHLDFYCLPALVRRHCFTRRCFFMIGIYNVIGFWTFIPKKCTSIVSSIQSCCYHAMQYITGKVFRSTSSIFSKFGYILVNFPKNVEILNSISYILKLSNQGFSYKSLLMLYCSNKNRISSWWERYCGVQLGEFPQNLNFAKNSWNQNTKTLNLISYGFEVLIMQSVILSILEYAIRMYFLIFRRNSKNLDMHLLQFCGRPRRHV